MRRWCGLSSVARRAGVLETDLIWSPGGSSSPSHTEVGSRATSRPPIRETVGAGRRPSGSRRLMVLVARPRRLRLLKGEDEGPGCVFCVSDLEFGLSVLTTAHLPAVTLASKRSRLEPPPTYLDARCVRLLKHPPALFHRVKASASLFSPDVDSERTNFHIDEPAVSPPMSRLDVHDVRKNESCK